MLLLLASLAFAQDARALLDAARYEDALAVATAAFEETGDPAALIDKADAFVGLGRDEEALWCLELWRRVTGGFEQNDRIAALRERIPAAMLADLVAEGLAEPDPPPAPAWLPIAATYRVRVPAEGPLQLEVSYRFRALREGWLDAALIGPGMVVTGATGPVVAAPSGVYLVLKPGTGETTVTVRGSLEGSPGSASLGVLPAAAQRVIVEAPGLDVEVAGAVDGALAAADRLALTWAPHVEKGPEVARPVVVAETATAAWGEEGALEVRARVRWRVLRGEVGRFVLDVSGLEEAEADGANVASQRREGSQLVIETREPVKGGFEVLVRGRAPLREAPMPGPRPVEVSRVDRWWTVGRSDEGELVPVGELRSVAQRTMPSWAKGLSESAPVASFHGEAAPGLRPARYEPLMGPDTVVEQADFVVTTSREGRVLLRATWRLRNERRQYLRVRPPAPGWVPLTARVSGQPVSVLSDGEGGVYVPLEKSVETVQGLLNFPVEVTWVGAGDTWEKKGERTFALPAVDAPIQSAAWELHLPRGVEVPGAEGVDGTVVMDTGDDEAEEAVQRAVDAYKSNEWDAAQHALDEARALGADDENVSRLQSNLDALYSKDTSTPDDTATRRVRELANAKTSSMQVKQEKKLEEARDAEAAGDLERASSLYGEVADLAKNIGVTEQKESAEQTVVLEEAQKALASTEGKKKKKAEEDQREAQAIEKLDADRDEVADGEDFYELDGVEGGVEGGVVGGVLGGVGDQTGVGGLGTYGHGAGGGGSTGYGTVGWTEPESVEEEPAPEPAQPVEVTAGTLVLDSPTRSAPRSDKMSETRRVAGTRRGSRTQTEIEFEDADRTPAKPAIVPAPAAAPAPQFAPVEIAGELEAPPPPPPPPRSEPEGRAALEVEASPFTVALPLAGATVRHEAALLPADAFPTLTVQYRTLPGAKP
ncbi:MAG: hypothetical protein ACOZNI_36215 [Myxococcota bacterium]